MTVAKQKVAVLIGSLRNHSFSQQLANAVAAATPGLAFDMVQIGHLSFYNQDHETATPPESWVEFRDTIRAADAVLFVTPEYNRSYPAVLKNAIDIGSRPFGKSVFDGKPAAVISQSPGALGAVNANIALRQVLVSQNMLTLAKPEFYLGNTRKIFDAETGAVTEESAGKFIAAFGAAFSAWIARVGAPHASLAPAH
jgi:chromate reductase, NAD(P)H dehydrogenase (quinone)